MISATEPVLFPGHNRFDPDDIGHDWVVQDAIDGVFVALAAGEQYCALCGMRRVEGGDMFNTDEGGLR